MRLDKDKIKESLTTDDIQLVLKDLGSTTPKQDTQGNLLFQTICHNHSGGKHKLYYYPKSHSFHCYTGCNCSYDIYSLVETVKKISFPDALKYVSNLTGKYYTSSVKDKNNHLINDWNFIERYKRKENINTQLPTYDEKVLDVFLPYGHEDWENEGISLETQKKFNICYYKRDDRIVIPHYNINKNLVGIRGRAMRKEDIDAGKKYMPLIVEGKLYNHPTMFNLYGLHKTQYAIKRLKKVAIFEAEKSIMFCDEFYKEDNFSVAVCGGNISKWHVQMLLDLQVEEVILCFDRQYHDPYDDEAQAYATKILKMAYKFTPYVRTYVVWDNEYLLDYLDSPVDKGKEKFETLLKRKIEIKCKDIKELY